MSTKGDRLANLSRSGRKPGSKNRVTLTKEAVLERLRDRMVSKLEPAWDAQLAHSQGVSYMILRNPDGTFTRATDVTQIDSACALGASAFRIFTQAPSTQAFIALHDRIFGKAPEQVTMTVAGSLTIVDRLHAARARLQRQSD